MKRGIQDATACREALSRLPNLEIGELRQQWRGLYKTQPPANLSRELLLRAVAYRMQEVALGGLRPPWQRQLRQRAQQFKQTGAASTPRHPELKPGTRLIREWQGRTYDACWRSMTASPGQFSAASGAIPLAIGRIGGAEAATLFKVLEEEQSPARRHEILQDLAQMQCADAVPGLLLSLADENAEAQFLGRDAL
jgi:hypothetical protein